MYKSYVAVAPKPEDFPRLLDAMGELMRQKYDWSADVAKLKMPVMLVFGDSDMFRPEHEIKFYQLLGGGLKDAGWNARSDAANRLAILPDLTHYDIFASPAPRGDRAAVPQRAERRPQLGRPGEGTNRQRETVTVGLSPSDGPLSPPRGERVRVRGPPRVTARYPTVARTASLARARSRSGCRWRR